jgi:hypothetical protein
MSYDKAGTLFALGVRVTNLDSGGAPEVGAGQSYITDSLIKADIGLTYEDANVITQLNGTGIACVSYSAPRTLKEGSIGGLQICQPDPYLLNFMMGGDIIMSTAESEVQTVTIVGGPTGGTFTLTFDGQVTAGIAFGATGATVETALEALPNLVPAEVAVAGPAGGPYVITFAGTLGDVPLIVANGAALTGPGAPYAMTVVETNPGVESVAIGYRAPEIGVVAVPNGVSLEFWSRAIIGSANAQTLPYIHWVLPLCRLTPAGTWSISGTAAMVPEFEGTASQSDGWDDGPLNDWPYPSDRVWQFARVAALPDFTAGPTTVLA